MNKPIQDTSTLGIVFLGILCLFLIGILIKIYKKSRENAGIIYGEVDQNDLLKSKIWSAIILAGLGLAFSLYEICKRVYHYIYF
jgi:hypothetical protein